MTKWIATFDVGTDDEASYEYNDDALLRVLREHVILADILDDGNVVMIRKANYLDRKNPCLEIDTKPFINENDKDRPVFTLLRGGLSD